MGKPFQLVDTTFLEKALDATSLRQQVISDNMANANNPEYQAKAVKFDEHLRDMVMRQESINAVRVESRARGMRTLRESGLMAIYEGQTTIDEVVRETVLDA